MSGNGLGQDSTHLADDLGRLVFRSTLSAQNTVFIESWAMLAAKLDSTTIDDPLSNRTKAAA